MKKIAFATAMMAGGAAFATPPAEQAAPEMQVENAAQAEAGLPNDPYEGVGGPAEERIYDGPDSYTPGQPPPDGNIAILRSRSMANFQPTRRAAYPTCSETVRDNCRQEYDPR